MVVLELIMRNITHEKDARVITLNKESIGRMIAISNRERRNESTPEETGVAIADAVEVSVIHGKATDKAFKYEIFVDKPDRPKKESSNPGKVSPTISYERELAAKYLACLQVSMETLNIKSIEFPMFGEHYFRVKEAFAVGRQAVLTFIEMHPNWNLETVYFTISSHEDMESCEKMLVLIENGSFNANSEYSMVLKGKELRLKSFVQSNDDSLNGSPQITLNINVYNLTENESKLKILVLRNNLERPIMIARTAIAADAFKTLAGQITYLTALLMMTRYQEIDSGISFGLAEEVAGMIKSLPQVGHFPLNTIADIAIIPSTTTKFGKEFTVIETIRIRKGKKDVHVCKAESKADGKTYVIKKVAKRVDFSNVSEKELCEIRFQANLDHTNIVRYYDAWIECQDRLSFSEAGSEFDKQHFRTYEYEQGLTGVHIPILHIQMELCSGTLQSYIDERTKEHEGPFIDEDVNRKMRIHLLSAIEYIHSKKLIHRDIKPDNIFTKMVNGDLVFLLGDFGLSCTHTVVNGKAESHELGIGNKYYMAPEQESSTYDHKIDIYSVGLVFAETYSFTGTSKGRILTNLKDRTKKLVSTAASWKNVGEVIKTNMVRYEPHLRLEATELLKLFNECVLKDEAEAKEKEANEEKKKTKNQQKQEKRKT